MQPLKRVLGRLWRKFAVDQCRDKRERIRRERISNIKNNVRLLEAMRRWEIESGAVAYLKE